MKFFFIRFLACTILFFQNNVIAQTNLRYLVISQGNQEIRFDDAALEKFKFHTYTTSTDWTNKNKFTGVLLSDLIKATKFKGTTLAVSSWDDYKVNIPMSDLEKFEPILTIWINGKKFDIQDNGPYWIIYDRDSNPIELNKSTYVARFAWHVKKIEIK